MKKITYCQAINEALHQEMKRDDSVMVYGIGCGDHKEIFGSTEGLQEKFGKDRVFDTPLSEDALTGFGIGAAMNGMRPVQIHIRADFALLAMNQIINMMSAVDYMSNGQLKCPMVIRIIIGRGWGQGFQHSKSLFSLFTHIPGLKVIAPSNPQDMKSLLAQAIVSDNPVICFEHRWLYWQEQEVDDNLEAPYFSKLYQNPKAEADITLLSYSWGVIECKKAAEILWEIYSVCVNIIDLRVLTNLDMEHIVSFIYTDECIIVEDDWLNNSVGAGFLAQYLDEKFNITNQPVNFSRIGWKNTPCPTARHLENDFYYDAKDIVLKVTNRLGLRVPDLRDVDCYSHENKFRGPF
tara:strand:- start:22186 stop:23235 length:1050 start_codon:yes stop_codon:yes gene_type:complete